jgi:hypothetical protein
MTFKANFYQKIDKNDCDNLWYWKVNLAAFHNKYVCLDNVEPRRHAVHFDRHFKQTTKMINRIAKKLGC